MKQQFKEPVLNLWYAALSTPYGVEIECLPDFDSVRNKLYTARTAARDDDLKKVALCQSPFDPGRLWLVRKEPQP